MRRIAIIMGCLYLAMFAAMVLGQRFILYVPHTAEMQPAEFGLKGVTAERFSVSGGEQVIVWHARPTTRTETILYFHGNGGMLGHRSDRFAFLQSQGYGLVVLSYRGYGGSSGRPSEAANVADAVMLYDWLRQRGVPPIKIVLFGESLGSGIAVQLAAQLSVGAILLDSPYSSIEDVAAARFWWLPVRGMVWERYDSMAHVAKLRAPLVVVQGDRDGIVPPHLGAKLVDAATVRKLLIVRDGEYHTPSIEPVWSQIERFLGPRSNR